MSQAAAEAAAPAPLVIGRYALFDELAAGGMATVHLGRLLGPEGFGRTVAVKRLHKHFLKDQEFLTMFMDEARIVARIRHPNVVPMVDVVQNDEGLFLIMEYVHGESLSRLMRDTRKTGTPIPPRVVASIMCNVLLGLHAAHDTKGSDGELLGVVHRDVSPQNVIVGVDGSARVLDFGIAKAAGRAQVTREGQIKGKLAYMAPEQIRGQVDRRTDVFAASVILWEMLAGRRLHEGSKEIDIVTRVVQGKWLTPSTYAPHVDATLDQIVLRGLATDPKARFASARDLALALERHVGLASPSEVADWVEGLAHVVLEARSNLVRAMERAASDLVPDEASGVPASLALPVEQAAGGMLIPVDHEPLHSASGDVPSSSAVFAHAQTANGSQSGAGPGKRIARETLIVMAISAALALAGLTLGTYALLHRAGGGAPAAVAPSASPTLPQTTTPPRVTSPPAPGSGASGSSPLLSPSAAGTASAPTAATASAGATATTAGSGAATGSSAPAGVVALEDAPSRPVASAAAAATASAAAAATAKAQPAHAPSAPLAAPAVKKPAKTAVCEPPYTVDDVGHRHYKPECMGLE